MKKEDQDNNLIISKLRNTKKKSSFQSNNSGDSIPFKLKSYLSHILKSFLALIILSSIFLIFYFFIFAPNFTFVIPKTEIQIDRAKVIFNLEVECIILLESSKNSLIMLNREIHQIDVNDQEIVIFSKPISSLKDKCEIKIFLNQNIKIDIDLQIYCYFSCNIVGRFTNVMEMKNLILFNKKGNVFLENIELENSEFFIEESNIFLKNVNLKKSKILLENSNLYIIAKDDSSFLIGLTLKKNSKYIFTNKKDKKFSQTFEMSNDISALFDEFQTQIEINIFFNLEMSEPKFKNKEFNIVFLDLVNSSISFTENDIFENPNYFNKYLFEKEPLVSATTKGNLNFIHNLYPNNIYFIDGITRQLEDQLKKKLSKKKILFFKLTDCHFRWHQNEYYMFISKNQEINESFYEIYFLLKEKAYFIYNYKENDCFDNLHLQFNYNKYNTLMADLVMISSLTSKMKYDNADKYKIYMHFKDIESEIFKQSELYSFIENISFFKNTFVDYLKNDFWTFERKYNSMITMNPVINFDFNSFDQILSIFKYASSFLILVLFFIYLKNTLKEYFFIILFLKRKDKFYRDKLYANDLGDKKKDEQKNEKYKKSNDWNKKKENSIIKNDLTGFKDIFKLCFLSNYFYISNFFFNYLLKYYIDSKKLFFKNIFTKKKNQFYFDGDKFLDYEDLYSLYLKFCFYLNLEKQKSLFSEEILKKYGFEFVQTEEKLIFLKNIFVVDFLNPNISIKPKNSLDVFVKKCVVTINKESNNTYSYENLKQKYQNFCKLNKIKEEEISPDILKNKYLFDLIYKEKFILKRKTNSNFYFNLTLIQNSKIEKKENEFLKTVTKIENIFLYDILIKISLYLFDFLVFGLPCIYFIIFIYLNNYEKHFLDKSFWLDPNNLYLNQNFYILLVNAIFILLFVIKRMFFYNKTIFAKNIFEMCLNFVINIYIYLDFYFCVEIVFNDSIFLLNIFSNFSNFLDISIVICQVFSLFMIIIIFIAMPYMIKNSDSKFYNEKKKKIFDKLQFIENYNIEKDNLNEIYLIKNFASFLDNFEKTNKIPETMFDIIFENYSEILNQNFCKESLKLLLIFIKHQKRGIQREKIIKLMFDIFIEKKNRKSPLDLKKKKNIKKFLNLFLKIITTRKLMHSYKTKMAKFLFRENKTPLFLQKTTIPFLHTQIILPSVRLYKNYFNKIIFKKLKQKKINFIFNFKNFEITNYYFSKFSYKSLDKILENVINKIKGDSFEKQENYKKLLKILTKSFIENNSQEILFKESDYRDVNSFISEESAVKWYLIDDKIKLLHEFKSYISFNIDHELYLINEKYKHLDVDIQIIFTLIRTKYKTRFNIIEDNQNVMESLKSVCCFEIKKFLNLEGSLFAGFQSFIQKKNNNWTILFLGHIFDINKVTKFSDFLFFVFHMLNFNAKNNIKEVSDILGNFCCEFLLHSYVSFNENLKRSLKMASDYDFINNLFEKKEEDMNLLLNILNEKDRKEFKKFKETHLAKLKNNSKKFKNLIIFISKIELIFEIASPKRKFFKLYSLLLILSNKQFKQKKKFLEIYLELLLDIDKFYLDKDRKSIMSIKSTYLLSKFLNIPEYYLKDFVFLLHSDLPEKVYKYFEKYFFNKNIVKKIRFSHFQELLFDIDLLMNKIKNRDEFEKKYYSNNKTKPFEKIEKLIYFDKMKYLFNPVYENTNIDNIITDFLNYIYPGIKMHNKLQEFQECLIKSVIQEESYYLEEFFTKYFTNGENIENIILLLDMYFTPYKKISRSSKLINKIIELPHKKNLKDELLIFYFLIGQNSNFKNKDENLMKMNTYHLINIIYEYPQCDNSIKAIFDFLISQNNTYTNQKKKTLLSRIYLLIVSLSKKFKDFIFDIEVDAFKKLIQLKKLYSFQFFNKKKCLFQSREKIDRKLKKHKIILLLKHFSLDNEIFKLLINFMTNTYNIKDILFMCKKLNIQEEDLEMIINDCLLRRKIPYLRDNCINLNQLFYLGSNYMKNLNMDLWLVWLIIFKHRKNFEGFKACLKFYFNQGYTLLKKYDFCLNLFYYFNSRKILKKKDFFKSLKFYLQKQNKNIINLKEKYFMNFLKIKPIFFSFLIIEECEKNNYNWIRKINEKVHFNIIFFIIRNNIVNEKGLNTDFINYLVRFCLVKFLSKTKINPLIKKEKIVLKKLFLKNFLNQIVFLNYNKNYESQTEMMCQKNEKSLDQTHLMSHYDIDRESKIIQDSIIDNQMKNVQRKKEEITDQQKKDQKANQERVFQHENEFNKIVNFVIFEEYKCKKKFQFYDVSSEKFIFDRDDTGEKLIFEDKNNEDLIKMKIKHEDFVKDLSFTLINAFTENLQELKNVQNFEYILDNKGIFIRWNQTQTEVLHQNKYSVIIDFLIFVVMKEFLSVDVAINSELLRTLKGLINLNCLINKSFFESFSVQKTFFNLLTILKNNKIDDLFKEEEIEDYKIIKSIVNQNKEYDEEELILIKNYFYKIFPLFKKDNTIIIEKEQKRKNTCYQYQKIINGYYVKEKFVYFNTKHINKGESKNIKFMTIRDLVEHRKQKVSKNLNFSVQEIENNLKNFNKGGNQKNQKEIFESYLKMKKIFLKKITNPRKEGLYFESEEIKIILKEICDENYDKYLIILKFLLDNEIAFESLTKEISHLWVEDDFRLYFDLIINEKKRCLPMWIEVNFGEDDNKNVISALIELILFGLNKECMKTLGEFFFSKHFIDKTNKKRFLESILFFYILKMDIDSDLSKNNFVQIQNHLENILEYFSQTDNAKRKELYILIVILERLKLKDPEDMKNLSETVKELFAKYFDFENCDMLGIFGILDTIQNSHLENDEIDNYFYTFINSCRFDLSDDFQITKNFLLILKAFKNRNIAILLNQLKKTKNHKIYVYFISNYFYFSVAKGIIDPEKLVVYKQILNSCAQFVFCYFINNFFADQELFFLEDIDVYIRNLMNEIWDINFDHILDLNYLLLNYMEVHDVRKKTNFLFDESPVFNDNFVLRKLYYFFTDNFKFFNFNLIQPDQLDSLKSVHDFLHQKNFIELSPEEYSKNKGLKIFIGNKEKNFKIYLTLNDHFFNYSKSDIFISDTQKTFLKFLEPEKNEDNIFLEFFSNLHTNSKISDIFKYLLRLNIYKQDETELKYLGRFIKSNDIDFIEIFVSIMNNIKDEKEFYIKYILKRMFWKLRIEENNSLKNFSSILKLFKNRTQMNIVDFDSNPSKEFKYLKIKLLLEKIKKFYKFVKNNKYNSEIYNNKFVYSLSEMIQNCQEISEEELMNLVINLFYNQNNIPFLNEKIYTIIKCYSKIPIKQNDNKLRIMLTISIINSFLSKEKTTKFLIKKGMYFINNLIWISFFLIFCFILKIQLYETEKKIQFFSLFVIFFIFFFYTILTIKKFL